MQTRSNGAGVAANIGLVAVCLLGTLDAQALESLRATWSDLELRATLNAAISPEVEQGSNMQLRIAANDDAAVAIILVNSDGQARVAVPNRGEADNRVTRGTELLFPDLQSRETLYADLPVGKGQLYVVASREPIFAPDAFASWQAVDRIERQIIEAGVPFGIRRLPFHVTAPDIKDFVTEEEFVNFFAVATRNVANASKGFKIEFDTNSAELTPWSRRQLDAVSAGMQNESLKSFRFMLEGHTDDVGEEQYNMGLSARRARSVYDYLRAKGISEARIGTIAMGESEPIMPGQSAAARSKNRRVVIRKTGE